MEASGKLGNAPDREQAHRYGGERIHTVSSCTNCSALSLTSRENLRLTEWSSYIPTKRDGRAASGRRQLFGPLFRIRMTDAEIISGSKNKTRRIRTYLKPTIPEGDQLLHLERLGRVEHVLHVVKVGLKELGREFVEPLWWAVRCGGATVSAWRRVRGRGDDYAKPSRMPRLG